MSETKDKLGILKTDKVEMKCSKRGCPRKRVILWDNTMPVGTKTIISSCPWHVDFGEKGSDSIYLDTLGKEILEPVN